MKLKFLILISVLILDLGLVSSQDGISIATVESTNIQPGETSQIRIIIENQGDNDIKNIMVSLDLVSDALPFAPVGSATQKIIDEIDENEKKTVTFEIVALPDAKPQIYKIPVNVKFNDKEESTIISLKVISQPVLEVAIEETEIIKVQDTGEVVIRFVNKGLSDIKFLSAQLIQSEDYNILSAESVYIGNIEPDDFETASFKLHLGKKINFLPIKVEFRDSENKIFTKTEFLNINIFTLEEAKSLGLTKTNSLPFIIGAAILIIIILIAYRLIRKRRRAKKLSL